MRMSFKFEEKGISEVKYSDKYHPLYKYLEGDTEMRGDIILTHTDVPLISHLH